MSVVLLERWHFTAAAEPNLDRNVAEGGGSHLGDEQFKLVCTRPNSGVLPSARAVDQHDEISQSQDIARVVPNTYVRPCALCAGIMKALSLCPHGSFRLKVGLARELRFKMIEINTKSRAFCNVSSLLARELRFKGKWVPGPRG